MKYLTDMYYEINVSFKGRHYFATAPRSLTTKSEMIILYRHFRKLFPAPDYGLLVYEYPEVHYRLDPENLNKKSDESD